MTTAIARQLGAHEVRVTRLWERSATMYDVIWLTPTMEDPNAIFKVTVTYDDTTLARMPQQDMADLLVADVTRELRKAGPGGIPDKLNNTIFGRTPVYTPQKPRPKVDAGFVAVHGAYMESWEREALKCITPDDSYPPDRTQAEANAEVFLCVVCKNDTRLPLLPALEDNDDCRKFIFSGEAKDAIQHAERDTHHEPLAMIAVVAQWNKSTWHVRLAGNQPHPGMLFTFNDDLTSLEGTVQKSSSSWDLSKLVVSGGGGGSGYGVSNGSGGGGASAYGGGAGWVDMHTTAQSVPLTKEMLFDAMKAAGYGS